MTATRPPAAIILSAGVSSRMGRDKALLEVAGETFLDRLARVLSLDCAPIIAVLGDHAPMIRAGIRNPGALQFVQNPDPTRGMLSSLQMGLLAVPDLSLGVLFTPVDVPMVSTASIRLLVDALQRGATVAVPVHQGKRGHPVAISRQVAERLIGLPETGRANEAMRAEASVEIAVSDEGVILEVDTPEDYEDLLCRVG